MTLTPFSRRSFFKWGIAAGVWPLAIAQANAPKRARGMILVMLEGGMSQYETLDPKPLAPREIRGEFETIPTSIPELRIGEHLPLMAEQMHRVNLLRAVHCDARNDHSPGMHLLLTGYENTAAGIALERKNYRNPSVGSILAKKLGAATHGGSPTFVALPASTQLNGEVNYNGASFLGSAYEAFDTGRPPRNAKMPGIAPAGLVLADQLSVDRVKSRWKLASDLNSFRPELDPHGLQLQRNAHYERAIQVLTKTETQKAFELERESPKLREAYGDHPTGQGLLLARRLIESGVTYVVVNTGFEGNWDTHAQNFSQLKQKLLPPLDRGLSTLLQDLDDRGELDDVLVLVAGEMGRTPLINENSGRDHWTNAYSVMIAGGGLTRGQVIGSTTRDGSTPSQRPVTVHDILATAYERLGIDPFSHIQDIDGRSIPILPQCEVISELFV